LEANIALRQWQLHYGGTITVPPLQCIMWSYCKLAVFVEVTAGLVLSLILPDVFLFHMRRAFLHDVYSSDSPVYCDETSVSDPDPSFQFDMDYSGSRPYGIKKFS
jgi:hypothetical protein